MEGQNQNDELYPIAVLIDELKVVAKFKVLSNVTHPDLSTSMMMSFYGLMPYTDSLQLL